MRKLLGKLNLFFQSKHLFLKLGIIEFSKSFPVTKDVIFILYMQKICLPPLGPLEENCYLSIYIENFYS